MLKKILSLMTITFFISCGEDLVEIKDTTIPNEPQEIFEVNVVGYSTDSEHNFLENVDLTINGNSLKTDSTSFFVENNIFVGKEGSVIKAKKAGFLPNFKRVYHHRSLEDVITNISMYELPTGQEISSEGGDVVSEDGSMLSFSANVFSQSSEVTFYTSFDEENQVDIDPFIVSEDEVQMLDDQALFYLGASGEIFQEGSVTIQFDADKISNIENLEVYKYDEFLLTWTLANLDLKEEEGTVVLNVDSFGWWAIGIAKEAIYGTLKVEHRDVSLTGIGAFRNGEVVFSKIEDRNSNEHLFTDSNGEISKYYPVGLRQEISIDNGGVTERVDISFDEGKREATIQFNEIAIQQIQAEVYDCQLSKQSGYVSMVKGNQYVIKRIESGVVDFFVSENDKQIEFRFYDLDETLLLSRTVDAEELSGEPIHFVACNSIMVVERDAAVIQDFDQCKVRVKPIESFIVGENSEAKLFFIAFRGDGVGMYDGLVYTDDIPLLSVAEIEKDVKVDIMIYDKISRTIAGFVDGKYRNGEAYKISFIGNIEE